jgi:hypothetical protein
MPGDKPSAVEGITSLQAAALLGIIGGVFIGKTAFQEMFVEGLEDEHRKNLLLLGAGGAAALALKYAFDLDDKWFTGEKQIEWVENQFSQMTK